jgi:hypothetical protein
MLLPASKNHLIFEINMVAERLCYRPDIKCGSVAYDKFTEALLWHAMQWNSDCAAWHLIHMRMNMHRKTMAKEESMFA